MIKKVVKDLLPKGLLPRLLLIFLVPLIIIQCSVIFFFYDRHWEKIINRFSNIAGNNINLIKDLYINISKKDKKWSTLKRGKKDFRVPDYKAMSKHYTMDMKKINNPIKIKVE